MKRTIAIVMALMMVITCVPGIAFAEGSGASKAGDVPTEQEIAEAKAAYERAAEQVAQAEITLNEKNDALAQAAGGLEHAQAVYEKVGWKFLNAQAGDDCTIEKLVAACAENATVGQYINTEKFNKYLKSATTVENLVKAADYVDYCNRLRADHDLAALKINAKLMVFSAVSAAVEGQKLGHIIWMEMSNIGSPMNSIPLHGENVAPGWSDPFEGWYYMEKEQYEQYLEDSRYPNLANMTAYEISTTSPYNEIYGKIGHYLNVIEPMAQITGFGHATEPSYVDEQAFGFTSSSSYGTNFTTDEFRSALAAYSADKKAALDNAQAAYDTAEAEVKTARETLEQAQADYGTAYENYRAAAALPAPTDLHWRDDSAQFTTMAVWGWESPEYIDHYEVTAKVEKKDGSVIVSDTQIERTISENYPYAYDFEDFFMENGSGAYSFKVKAVAKENSGRFDSEEAELDPVTFCSLKTRVMVVNEQGEEIDQDDVQGAISFYHDEFDREHMLGGGTIISFHDTMQPAGRKIEISENTDMGYVYQGVDFDHAPADLETFDDGVRFTLSDSHEVTVKIYKDERTIPVDIIFGDGHEELAQKVKEVIQEEQEYECDGDADTLLLRWPLASTVSDLRDYVEGLIYEQFEDQDEPIENDERWMGKLGLHSLDSYSAEKDIEDEESATADNNVNENGMDLYVLWETKATAGAFNVEAPVCGTKVSIRDEILAGGTIKVQTVAPYVTTEEDSQLQIAEFIPGYSTANWYRACNATLVAPYSGTEYWHGYYDSDMFKGDVVYYVGFPVVAKFKYYIDYEDLPVNITINGMRVFDEIGTTVSSRYGMCVIGEVIGAHTWDDGTIINAATCTEDGVKECECTYCHETRPVTIKKLGHDYGDWERLDDEQHQRVCSHDASHTVTEPHNWDAGEVTVEATRDVEGEMIYTCAVCGATKTEAIPKTDPAKQKGEDGTSYGKGASDIVVEKAILKLTKDSDPKGTKVYPLLLRSPKQTKTSVTLKWSKPSGAVKYVIYGNVCGKGKKYKKLKTLSKTSITLKKAVKKIAKGKYYKFIVVSLDKNNDVVSTSKVLHIATKGGKVGNYKSVKTKAKKNRVTVSTGKTFKLVGKGVAVSRKLKVKSHVGIRYESAKPSVATVSTKGVIKGVKKGTTYVYAYSQSGTYAKIKVTVK